MRVLVAGGTGFIGRRFVHNLAARGVADIAVLSRRGPSDAGSRVRHIDADWHSAFRDERVVGFKPTVLVNMVGGSHPRSSIGNELAEIRSGLLPFFELLDVLGQRGLERVVFCSSAGSIYQSGVAPVEKPQADSAYFSTKRSTEHYLSSLSAASGLSAVSLRISNPIGDAQREGFGIVNQFSEAIATGRPVEFIGDHRLQKDYVDLDDVADAIVSVTTAATGPGANEASFNGHDNAGRGQHHILDVGSGWAIDAPGMHDLITAMAEGRPLPGAPFVRSGLDLDAIGRLTGWAPRRDLVDSIRRLYRLNEVRLAGHRP